MKTEKAKIKLIVRTNKTLSDNTHPIMLRINWQGVRKEKSTGFSCKPNNWSTNDECLKIKGRDAIPNAVTINAIILELKQQAEKIRDSFILNNISYSSEMIMEQLNNSNKQAEVNTIKNIAQKYIKVNHLKEETIISLNGIVKHFHSYMGKDEVLVDEVNKSHAIGFGRWCAEQGFKNNTIRTNIQKMKSLFTYAEENEIIKSSPFKGYRESKAFKAENNKQSLTKEAFLLLRQFYLRDCILYAEQKGEQKLQEKFLVVGNRYFAYNVFFMSFYMQGLALIDLAKLKIESIDSTRISDSENRYIIINTYRSKTRKQVQVAIRMDNFTSFIFPVYLKYMVDSGFLLPILSEKDDTSKKIVIKMRSATTAINHNLKKIWEDYNNWIKELIEKYENNNISYQDKILVEKFSISNENISKFLIDHSTTMYSARHTFATIFINTEGAKSSELAQMMGRSVAGIDRYIRELMTIEDVLNAKDKMLF